jgi:hypothetical protein
MNKMEAPHKETKKVKVWLDTLITQFREAYEKFSEPEKQHIPNNNDYRPPCQLEVFWLKDPEYQLLVLTHSAKRPDRQIIINGPYQAFEFRDKVEKKLDEQRWKESPSPQDPMGYVGELTYAEMFSSIVANFIKEVKNSIFTTKHHQKRMGGMILGYSAWVSTFRGNMSELDTEQMIKEIVKQVKGRGQEAMEKPKKAKPAPLRLKGFGTYFFPPIWVGSISKPTIRDRLHGQHRQQILKKALDYSSGDLTFVVNNDGFIVLHCDTKETALRILNTIMGTSLLLGIPTLTVRSQELANIEIEPNTLTITSRGITLTSLRTYLIDPTFSRPFHFDERRVVSQQKIQEILRRSVKILKDPTKIEKLSFLLEANTHFINSEYSQAFIMSWIIVEKYLFSLWETYLKQKQISNKRKTKLVNPTFWTTDTVLETLNLNGDLGLNEYRLLMNLKKKRNNFIHKGTLITKQATEQCLALSTKIVKRNLSNL